VIVALLVFGLDLARLWRETNSHVTTARGVKQFSEKKYADAQTSFARSSTFAGTPARAFNLGTSQIAAGNREVGSSTIARALADPSLRADALFNRGNGALASNSFDDAIRDFRETLRLQPYDAAAKRNLEIALRRIGELGSGLQPGIDRRADRAGAAPTKAEKPTSVRGAASIEAHPVSFRN